jgi:inorganic pyrophosphatase
LSLQDVPVGQEAPDVINIIIEIPADSKNKYEYDEELHIIKLDRVAYTAMAHPYDYGFIPETRSEDGDHLDAFVLMDHSAYPGILVQGRPIGLLRMIDDGEHDEKILCAPVDDKRYDHIKDLGDISLHIPKEIAHYFEHYKDLKGKKVEILGWDNAAAAKAEVKRAMETFKSEA